MVKPWPGPKPGNHYQTAQQSRARILGILERRVRIQAKHDRLDISVLLGSANDTFCGVTAHVVNRTLVHAELVQNSQTVEKVLQHRIGLGSILGQGDGKPSCSDSGGNACQQMLLGECNRVEVEYLPHKRSIQPFGPSTFRQTLDLLWCFRCVSKVWGNISEVVLGDEKVIVAGLFFCHDSSPSGP